MRHTKEVFLLAGACVLIVTPPLRAEEPTGTYAGTDGPPAEDRRLLSLIDQLRDDELWKSRLEAAVVLGRSGDIRVRRPLIRALTDPNYAVRAAAARGLALLQDLRAVLPLLDSVQDDEPYVRSEARRALESFDIEQARPYFIQALRRHQGPEVRLVAAERLAESTHPTAMLALLDASGDEAEVSRFAVSAIRALPEEKAVSLFLSGLSHPDYRVQIASIDALGELGTPKATDPLITLLDSQVPEVTLAVTRALRNLSPHIDRKRMFVLAKRASRFERARAIKILGILGGEDAALLLLHAVDDPDVLVRGAAVSGLSCLGDPRAIPKLEEMRKHEANGRIIALVRTTLTNLKVRSQQQGAAPEGGEDGEEGAEER